MRISIVVPAFNEERLIGQTLASIRRAAQVFAARNWATEIIVCDNNSTDRTAEIARAAEATVVFEPVNQIARARNRGARSARGEWLIFVDADSQPSPDLFAEVAQQIESGLCLAGGCTLRLEGDHLLLNLLAASCNLFMRQLRWMAGSFIFCHTGAFQRVGGFSDKLFAGEEIELSRRLKKLARAERKNIVILHRHPLLTSARKAHLYSGREYASFLLKMVLSGGRAVADRGACHPWYDGRR